MAKLHELHFKLLPHPPYSPDLAPAATGYSLISKNAPRKFISNEEAIAETEAYFEVKGKACYNHGIEKLEKRLNDCIAFE